jgi:hypothetical protein
MILRNVALEQSLTLVNLALDMLQNHQGETKNATAARILGRTMHELGELSGLSRRASNTIQPAVKSAEDAVEFTKVNGTWVSADCAPVRVEPARQQCFSSEVLAEEAFICSPELASRLIQLLLNPVESAPDAGLDVILAKIRKSGPPSAAADQLVGISLRAVLHFAPGTTFMHREKALADAVRFAEQEILRTEVDGVFRINNLWLALRCCKHVVDVGEPYRPFEELLIWRDGKGEPLLENYILQPGERMFIEPSIPAPIDIQASPMPQFLI